MSRVVRRCAQGSDATMQQAQGSVLGYLEHSVSPKLGVIDHTLHIPDKVCGPFITGCISPQKVDLSGVCSRTILSGREVDVEARFTYMEPNTRIPGLTRVDLVLSPVGQTVPLADPEFHDGKYSASRAVWGSRSTEQGGPHDRLIVYGHRHQPSVEVCRS